MAYRIVEDGPIVHGFFKKGDKKKDHKYIARIGESPKYRYFYTNAEYQAYLKFNKLKNDIGNKLNGVKTDAKTLTTTGKNYLTNIQNGVNLGLPNKAKPSISNTISKAAKEAISNVAAKSKEFLRSAAKSKSVSLVTSKEAAKEMKKDSIKIDTGKGKPGKIRSDIKPTLDKNTVKSLSVLNDWRDQVKALVKQVTRPNPPTFKALKHKQTEMSRDEDMARVNPYLNEDKSFTINCAYCTAAYDLRRRGYDVEADDYHMGTEPDEKLNNYTEEYSWYTHKNKENLPAEYKGTLKERFDAFVFNTTAREMKYLDDLGNDSFNTKTEKAQAYFDVYYPGMKYFSTDEFTSSQIEKEILKQGNGARGHMMLHWRNEGSGHAVVYEVVNNEVVIRDAQHNKTLKLDDYAKYADEVKYFRTDNEEPTSKILNCVKNKSSDTTCPGDNGGSKTTPSALAEKYRNAGYEVVFTTIGGEYGYKVYLTEGRYTDDYSYLIIDPYTGATKYVNEKLEKGRNKR